MKELIEDVIYYLKNNKDVKYEELEKYIKKVSKINKDHFYIIKALEEEGIIYSIDGIYNLLPNNYNKGVLESSLKGNTYVIKKNGTKLNIKKDKLNGALPNDEIIYSEEGEIIKIINRKSSPVLCQIKEKDGIKILVPHNIRGVLNLKVSPKNLKNLYNGDYILVKPDAEKYNDAFYCELIGSKIILTNTKIDENLAMIAVEHECDLEYSKEANEEVKNLPDETSKEDIESRKNHDFRKDIIFTIDGITTKDMDDAVGYKKLKNGNHEITVNIAEPNHYAKIGSALQKEAQKRKFTMYLLNIAIHMFPPKMANGICSLNEKVDRLTKSVVMEIDKDGNIVNSKVCKSVINSKKKMTYDDVNSILDNDIVPAGYEPFIRDLKSLKEITDIINEKREKNGLIKLETIKTNIHLDDENNATFNKEQRGTSEKMIETLMILANAEIGTIMKNSPFPGAFRTHGTPNKIILNDICDIIKNMGYNVNKKEILKEPRKIINVLNEIKEINDNDFQIVCNLFLSSFMRAKYSTKQEMHWALFLECYTHFTSPIRRYFDYIVHELIDRFMEIIQKDEIQIRENYKEVKYNIKIDKHEYKNLKQTLDDDFQDATRKERLFDQAEYQANQLIILKSMKELIGTSYVGNIQMIEPEYIKIITNNGIQGTVRIEDIEGDNYFFDKNRRWLIGENTNTKLKIGNQVTLTVKEIDDFRKDVLFTLNSKLTEVVKTKKLQKK